MGDGWKERGKGGGGRKKQHQQQFAERGNGRQSNNNKYHKRETVLRFFCCASFFSSPPPYFFLLPTIFDRQEKKKPRKKSCEFCITNHTNKITQRRSNNSLWLAWVASFFLFSFAIFWGVVGGILGTHRPVVVRSNGNGERGGWVGGRREGERGCLTHIRSRGK